ncbi:MAG: hypothetical protein ACREAW_11140 [Nitrososphaera sp.]
MQTKHLLTFVAIAVLAGAIVSMTASGMFAQADNNMGEEEEDEIAELQGMDEEEDDDTEDEAEDEGEDENEFTSSFMAENCTFNSTGSNPFFILEPNYQLVLAGEEEGEQVELIVTVLDETKQVNGTETRVVEERESVDGELVEVSRNFFAICEETNSVFYFGEEVDDYEDGEIVGHEGAWLAGEDNATAGIMMPGTTLLGARYYNEIAPDVALDRAEIIEDDEELETPAGTFENVLVIRETTPLEPDVEEFKYYAAGIGLLQDEDLKLEEHGFIE